MLLRNVANQLLNHDGLTDAGAAEDADLSALLERADKVDDLDAGLEEFGLGGEIFVRWCGAVNWQVLIDLRFASLVNRLTEHVEHTAERSSTNGHRDRCAEVGRLCAAGEPVGGGHGNGAHAIVAKVLLHLNNERTIGSINAYGVVNRWQLACGELNVNDRPRNRNYGSYGSCLCCGCVRHHSSCLSTFSSRLRLKQFRSFHA